MSIIDIDLRSIKPTSNQISFGSPSLGVGKHYFIKNGKPWFPIMGEFHYSRYNHCNWLSELQKIKSGGIDIVSSYVIWIHHEEQKNSFNFTGNLNLRQFILDCQKSGLYFWLRLGPWCHAEVRNGGFPDWLLKDVSHPRTNDPKYLHYVQAFFKEIYQQCRGLFYEDGGPIIGIQIENEYGHSGGETGISGKKHLKTLKKMIDQIGFKVPFYTATAWGGATWLEDETIPAFGGYADQPWAQTTEKLPLNQNYLIISKRDDPNIASDYPSSGGTNEIEFKKFPYITAELGTGLQPTFHRRPQVTSKDTYSMVVSKLASGANLLGYYMYHGGTNPIGKLSSFEESKASGSPNNLAKLTYDFQAPIGEYGQLRHVYFDLRRLHTFIHQFQTIIARSVPIFPEKPVINPNDSHSLRYSIRYDAESESGFIFINNYQRGLALSNHPDIQFKLKLPKQEILTPTISIKNGDVKILPFNLKTGDTRILSSNADLLGVTDNNIIFSTDDPHSAKINTSDYTPSIKIISDAEAYHSDIHDGQFINKNYPFWFNSSHTLNTLTPLKTNSNPAITYITGTDAYKEYLFKPKYSSKSDDVFLYLNYLGDRLEICSQNKLIADWLTITNNYSVSLKQLGNPLNLTIRIYNWKTQVYFEQEFSKNEFGLKKAWVQPYNLTQTQF